MQSQWTACSPFLSRSLRVVTRIEKLGREGLGTRREWRVRSLVITPIFARARGFKHSTDRKRKGGLQAVYNSSYLIGLATMVNEQERIKERAKHFLLQN